MKGRPSPTETFRTTPPAPCACASTKAETTSWQIRNKYNDQFPAVTIPEYKFKEVIQKNREFQIGLKNPSATVTYFHVLPHFLNLFTLLIYRGRGKPIYIYIYNFSSNSRI